MNSDPTFSALNPHAPLQIYHRNLPHWRQDGATYFVTLRLGDSIPRKILEQWKEEDHAWLKAHGIHTESNEISAVVPKELRRVFFRRRGHRIHIELDQSHGRCLFSQPDSRKILSSAIDFFHGARWWVGDYVIMPNHVHGLFQPMMKPQREANGPEDRSTTCPLEEILGSVKSFVSNQLTKRGIKTGKLWQQENYDRLVRDHEELAIWRRYIEKNPVKAKLPPDKYHYHRCEWL
ncbi:MAG: hypothetical protein JXR40_13330 [Pontiellaceae bacterium]|nr:hypothetical protein [Pontiellaceae bacterium]